jgi:iron complex transport system substrate-binding protein
MKNITCYLLLVTCYLLIGCGKEPSLPAGTQTLTDATGVKVPISPLPGRIISCAPSITQNIYLLRSNDFLVGVTKYCKLPEWDKKQVIGDLSSQNVEKILQLRPDLVLFIKEGNQPEFAGELRKLGIRVFVFPEANSWKDIKEAFLQMALLLGKTKDAEKLIKNYESELIKLKAKNQKSQPKIFVQLSEQYHTAGKDTFIDEAISQANCINIAHNALGRWPMLSIEQVIKEDPDLILITSMGEIEVQAKEAWNKFPALKAVKNNSIQITDADTCCSPTPDNFVKLVALIKYSLALPAIKDKNE